MIVGAHSILYSTNAEADRAFLRDVLGFPHADAGQGWLIFGLPPGEVAVHPGDENDVHELYLLCDDVRAFVADMARKGVACSEVQAMGWGMLTQVTLPGGGRLGVYQPRHARPRAMSVRRVSSTRARGRGPRRARAGTRTRKPARRPRRR